MSRKMIFMLLSPVWGLIREMKGNFEHLVHETRPRTCGRMVFKFIKKQTKSENHEFCEDLVISYVQAVVKNWEGFAQSYHVQCLQTEVSQKKNYSVVKASVRFGVKVMVELGFDFITFCIGNREHRLIHV